MYLASIDHPRRLLKKIFMFLKLKGEPVDVFLPNNDDREIISMLGEIEPQIKKESDILHFSSKLKDFP